MTDASAVGPLPLPEAGCAGCFFRPIAEQLRAGLASEECCTRVWTAFVTGLTFLVFTLAGVVPALLLYGEWCLLSTHEQCQRAVEPIREQLAHTRGELANAQWELTRAKDYRRGFGDGQKNAEHLVALTQRLQAENGNLRKQFQTERTRNATPDKVLKQAQAENVHLHEVLSKAQLQALSINDRVKKMKAWCKIANQNIQALQTENAALKQQLATSANKPT